MKYLAFAVGMTWSYFTTKKKQSKQRKKSIMFHLKKILIA